VSRWGKVELRKICTVNMGQSPNSSTYNQDGYGIPFYQGNADFGELHPKPRYYCTKPAKLAQRGDILISVRAPIGDLNIATSTCCIGRGLAALTAFEDITYPKYLYYLLRAKNKELNQKGTGSTFKAISKQTLNKVLCPLLPLEIQKHIAKTLDIAQDLLTLRKQQLAELDNLVKSVFYDMFGNPVINEKGWEVIRFSDIVTEKPKNRVFAKSDKYCDDGNADIIWISDFIDKMKCDITQLRRIIVTEKQIRNYKVSYGDLLFCRSSLTKAGIGKCGYVPLDVKENTLFECHIIKTKIDLKKVNPVFLQVQTTTNYCRNQVLAYSKTSTMTTIAQGDLLKTFIVLPPLTLQNQFADIVAKIEDQKDLVKKAIDETQYLFDCLMSEYFN
jgi:type I restriction enzyme S subunit